MRAYPLRLPVWRTGEMKIGSRQHNMAADEANKQVTNQEDGRRARAGPEGIFFLP
jgi:hypothetical protein